MRARYVAVLSLLLAAPALAGCLAGDDTAPPTGDGSTPPAASGLFSYSAPTLLPASSGVSEPHIAVDSEGRIFISAPGGVPSSSPAWVSEDNGATWTKLAPNPTVLGGGDTSIAIGPTDEIYITDLYAGSSSIHVSTDHGKTWFTAPVASQIPYNDREWNTVDNDGAAYYLGRTFTPGVAAWVSRSDDGGRTWVQQGSPWNQALPGDANQGRQDGNFFTNPKTNAIAVTYTCATNSVCLSHSTDKGLTWTPSVAAKGSGSVANIFPAAAADRAGNYYVAYAERMDKDTQIMMAHSADGKTWSKPIQITDTPGLKLFPWMVAGNDGRISITWYGTDAQGNNNDVNDMKDAEWRVFAAVSLDARSAAPTFHIDAVTPDPIKSGTVSTGGLGGSADRSLGDFFSNALGPDGRVHFAYIEKPDTRSLAYIVQTGGPSLL